MIQSMTGYGRGRSRHGDLGVYVDIKSVNNRFLEINIRMNKRYNALEDMILETTKQTLRRGKVEISVYIQEGDTPLINYKLNTPAVREYFALLQKMKHTLELGEEPGFQQLLAFDDVYTTEENKEWFNVVSKILLKALRKALKELQNVQKTEGMYLEKDIAKRAEVIGKKVNQIERLSPKRYPPLRKQISAVRPSFFTVVPVQPELSIRFEVKFVASEDPSLRAFGTITARNSVSSVPSSPVS